MPVIPQKAGELTDEDLINSPDPQYIEQDEEATDLSSSWNWSSIEGETSFLKRGRLFLEIPRWYYDFEPVGEEPAYPLSDLTARRTEISSTVQYPARRACKRLSDFQSDAAVYEGTIVHSQPSVAVVLTEPVSSNNNDTVTVNLTPISLTLSSSTLSPSSPDCDHSQPKALFIFGAREMPLSVPSWTVLLSTTRNNPNTKTHKTWAPCRFERCFFVSSRSAIFGLNVAIRNSLCGTGWTFLSRVLSEMLNKKERTSSWGPTVIFQYSKDAGKKLEDERGKRKDERKRVEEERQREERQREDQKKAEEEKQKEVERTKSEEERKKLEEERRKLEEERQKAEKERRREEEERKEEGRREEHMRGKGREEKEEDWKREERRKEREENEEQRREESSRKSEEKADKREEQRRNERGANKSSGKERTEMKSEDSKEEAEEAENEAQKKRKEGEKERGEKRKRKRYSKSKQKLEKQNDCRQEKLTKAEVQTEKEKELVKKSAKKKRTMELYSAIKNTGRRQKWRSAQEKAKDDHNIFGE
ncbi:hypothetical protein PROFUN_08213 [Planoprotostelium fungivorum]|uniref:Uncharacterized protein n=1 Tax=Planoprotostelium fungivorum TaxID=1890364 RepID=A0A2P6N667_9EUKA|nr:hypothetical protein PROFUN_08213 [Planoprotostelium fungivorum]